MSQNEQSRSGLEFEPFQVSKLVISKVCRDGKKRFSGGQHCSNSIIYLQCAKLVKKSTDFENSDIIPGLYEGGYKVWECCIDLSEYLAQSHDRLAGKRVI